MTEAMPGSLYPGQSLCMKSVLQSQSGPTDPTPVGIWMTQRRLSFENTVQNAGRA